MKPIPTFGLHIGLGAGVIQRHNTVTPQPINHGFVPLRTAVSGDRGRHPRNARQTVIGAIGPSIDGIVISLPTTNPGRIAGAEGTGQKRDVDKGAGGAAGPASAASGIAIPFGLSPFGRLFSSMTISPLLTFRTLGCRSPSWGRAARMRNAQWRIFLREASGTPQAEAPSTVQLAGGSHPRLRLPDGRVFWLSRASMPAPASGATKGSLPPPRPLALRARCHTRARSLPCGAPAAPAPHRACSISTRHAPVQSDLGTF